MRVLICVNFILNVWAVQTKLYDTTIIDAADLTSELTTSMFRYVFTMSMCILKCEILSV